MPRTPAIPGATVTVKTVETGATRTATTDETGAYRVVSVPVGPQEVRAEKTGFKTAVRLGINLAVGQEAVANLRLEVGAVSEEVTVTAETPLVNTTTSAISGLVNERQIKELPLNGRSFDNLMTLNPGDPQLCSEEPAHQHQQWKYVFRGGTASHGKRGSAERDRIHRNQPAGGHSGRRQRRSAGDRRGARIQRAYRFLRRRVWQARGRTGQRGHPVRNQCAAWIAVRVSPEQRSGFPQRLR